MERGRFAIGIAAGLLFGVAIVASSAFATETGTAAFLNLSPAKGPVNGPVNGSVDFTTTGTGSTSNSSDQIPLVAAPSAAFNQFGTAASPSHLNRLSAQPVEISGIVLLPILAAILLGLVLYRVSSNRADGGSVT